MAKTVKKLQNYNGKLRRKNWRQRSKHPKNMPNYIKIIIMENEQMYKCNKCSEISKRRYNLERHFKRFHVLLSEPKKCCGKSFYTKSDFYDHRQKIHNEQKKYIKHNINKNISKVILQDTYTTEFFMGFSEIQNDNKISPLNNSLSAPKKYLLYKWQKNNENKSRRSLMKQRSELIKKRKTNSLNLDKKNITIYEFTFTSAEDIDKLNCIVF